MKSFKQISVNISSDTKTALQKQADAESRTLANLIRVILEKHVQEAKNEM